MRASVWGLAVMGCLLATGRVSAHGIDAECRLKGARVEVEAYYDDDTVPGNARVTVLDAAGKKVAEGRTDDEGRWSFAVPPPGQYQVIVDAGDGHKKTKAMTVPSEFSGVRLSDGPSHADFTRVPWLKVVLGLGLIGAAGLALRFTLGRLR